MDVCVVEAQCMRPCSKAGHEQVVALPLDGNPFNRNKREMPSELPYTFEMLLQPNIVMQVR